MEAPAEPVEELRQPLALSQRPLTLPRGTLRVDGSVDLLGPLFAMQAGAGFGVTDDLEVGALLVPVFVNWGFGGGWFSNMVFYGMHRLTQGRVEVAARADVMVPTDPQEDLWHLTLAVPVLIRAGERVRIDTGVQLAMALASDANPRLAAVDTDLVNEHPLATRGSSGIPLLINVNASDQFYLGLRTGLSIWDFSDARRTLSMPLGVHMGGTVRAARGPLADVTVRFEWPENAFTTFWRLTLAASFYIHLL
jgi:hypothetical protein